MWYCWCVRRRGGRCVFEAIILKSLTAPSFFHQSAVHMVPWVNDSKEMSVFVVEYLKSPCRLLLIVLLVSWRSVLLSPSHDVEWRINCYFEPFFLITYVNWHARSPCVDDSRPAGTNLFTSMHVYFSLLSAVSPSHRPPQQENHTSSFWMMM